MIAWIRRQLWRFRVSEPDPEAFLDDLRKAQSGRYTRMERYKDFRAVFMGSDAGKRVLWQILRWGKMFGTVAQPNNPHMTYFRDGERNIGLRIMHTMNAEPAEQPTKVITKQE